jgi:hypothetical protein
MIQKGEAMTSKASESGSPPKWAGAPFILALLGCATAPPQPDYFRQAGKAFHAKLRAEANRSVTVSPDLVVIGLLENPRGDRNLTYIPWEVRVRQGVPTPVTWVSWDGTFTLTFKPEGSQSAQSPLEGGQTEVTSTSDRDEVVKSKTATVNSNQPGKYYFKVVLTTPQGKKYEDLDCPPIIIEVPPIP